MSYATDGVIFLNWPVLYTVSQKSKHLQVFVVIASNIDWHTQQLVFVTKDPSHLRLQCSLTKVICIWTPKIHRIAILRSRKKQLRKENNKIVKRSLTGKIKAVKLR